MIPVMFDSGGYTVLSFSTTCPRKKDGNSFASGLPYVEQGVAMGVESFSCLLARTNCRGTLTYFERLERIFRTC